MVPADVDVPLARADRDEDEAGVCEGGDSAELGELKSLGTASMVTVGLMDWMWEVITWRGLMR
jgi:hypothetical protein